MELGRMRKAVMALAGTAVFFSRPWTLRGQEADFQLRVEAPESVVAGTDFSATLRGSSSADLLGYTTRIMYDPDLLALTSDDFFSGTVWEEAEFLSAQDDPAAGCVLVGVVLDQGQSVVPRFVSAGGDLAFLQLGFHAADVTEVTATTIGFSPALDDNLLADVDLAGHDTGNGLELAPAAIDIVPFVQTRFRRGDCNGDGTVTGQVADALFLLLYNFSGGAEPPCLAACDANGDGVVSGQVSDAIYLLLFNFNGGAAPVAPFPGCGPSALATDEILGCETSTGGCQ